MKEFLPLVRGAVVSVLILAAVTCGLYPLLVYGVAQIAFRDQANGSLIVDDQGQGRGSRLLGQGFTGRRYFHPRPSAAGANGYDATASGGSNLGPTSKKLTELIGERVSAYRKENGLRETDSVSADAVTASGSGLDPHISPENAHLQVVRVAAARGLSPDQVRALIDSSTDRPDLGILGEPGVNVLRLNRLLDAQ